MMKIFEYSEYDLLMNLKKILDENEIDFIFCNEKKIDLIFFLSDFCDLSCKITSTKIIQIFEKIDHPDLLKRIIIFFNNDFSLKYFLEIINSFENHFTNIFYNFLQKNYFNYEKNVKQILEIKEVPDELKNTLEKILQVFKKFFLFLNKKNFFLDSANEENFENFIKNCFIFIDEFLFLIEETGCTFEINTKYKNFFTINDSKHFIINNFYLAQKNENQSNKSITLFLIEEIDNNITNDQINCYKKNIFVIDDDSDLKKFEKILEQNANREEEKNQLLNKNYYILVNQNLESNLGWKIFVHSQIYFDQSNFSDSYNNKFNPNDKIIENNDLKNFNDEGYFLKIYKNMIYKSHLKMEKISIHGLKKFFNNEEKFLKEEILKLKNKKFFDDKFLLSNNFDFFIDEIIRNFLLENKENQTNIVLKKIIGSKILEKYHKDYFQFIWKKITPFFENFFNFHSEILSRFQRIIFCQSAEIKIKNIKIYGFCLYIIFERNKIILIDVYYKHLSKKDFENFTNPRMLPIISHYKEQYPDFEIESKYFSDEKIFNIDKAIVYEFEKAFLKKLENI